MDYSKVQGKIYSDAPDVDFSTAREMARYLEEPKAMYVGAPGKRGYLNLGFELDKQGKSIMRELDRRAPLIVQQELYFDEQLPGLPCVYILSSGGPNVDGDRYTQNISLKKDSMAFISTEPLPNWHRWCITIPVWFSESRLKTALIWSIFPSL